MSKIWNENMVDYMIDGLPVYKKILEYKGVSQRSNYRNHIKIVNKYKNAKDDYEKIKDNLSLMKYVKWYSKHNITHYLNAGKFPNWYFYKDESFINAIDKINEKLISMIVEMYGGRKHINIYDTDGSIFHKRTYALPDDLDWIFSDCFGTYVVVNGKRVSNIRFPYVESKDFDKNFELFEAMMHQENVEG